MNTNTKTKQEPTENGVKDLIYSSELDETVKQELENGFAEIQKKLSQFHQYSYDNGDFLVNVTSLEMTRVSSLLTEEIENRFVGRSLRVLTSTPKHGVLLNLLEMIPKYKAQLEEIAVDLKEEIVKEVKIQFPPEVVVILNMKEILGEVLPKRQTLKNLKNDKLAETVRTCVIKQVTPDDDFSGKDIPLNKLSKNPELFASVCRLLMESKVDMSYPDIRISTRELQMIGEPQTKIENIGFGFRAKNFGVNDGSVSLGPGSITRDDKGAVLHLMKILQQVTIPSKIDLSNGKSTFSVSHNVAYRELAGIRKNVL